MLSLLLLPSLSAVAALAIYSSMAPSNQALAAFDITPPTPPPAAAPVPAKMDVSPAALAASFKTTVSPMMQQYCFECHGNGNHKGDMTLDAFKTVEDVQKNRGQWEEILKDLRTGAMPVPTAKLRPSQPERKLLTDWIEAELYPFDPAHPYPGRVTLRRLNRAEYNNTMRDLLGVDLKPADSFPIDDTGYGFDNNGDVLSIAPMLMEKYINAAGTVLDKAINATPTTPPPLKHWDGATMAGTIPPSDPKATTAPTGPTGRTSLLGRVINYTGEIYVDYTFPATGTYSLRMSGYGKQRPLVQFKIDGVAAGPAVVIPQDLPNAGVYGPEKIKVTAGNHRITLALTNGATKQEYDAAIAALGSKPAATAPAATAPAQAGGRPARGGAAGGRAPVPSITGKPTVGIVYVEAEGPLETTPDRMPESYRRVMIAQPSATVTKAQAAEKIIRNFTFRAFRRPVDENEIKQLMKLWTHEDAAGEAFEASIQTTLQAVLASPYFLYRYEQDPDPKDPGAIRTLDEFELATRLSYFLWSSMPDDELFNLARDGKLRANLQAQVRRMLNSPKSMALVENFAGQWLQLRQLANAGPDPMKFPNFDEPLRAAMLKETQLYFSSIMTEDRSVLDFIDSNYTFLNERLAKHYGRTDIKGDDFRRVALTDKQRGGLLTQASILTLTSYSNRTSPVIRGKWVLENLLDAAPPPPPPDVPKLVETAQAEISGTLRQRMEQHRTNPNCITCHAQMDPIGFGLENFDAIGAWRDKDINNVVIDSSGSLPDGITFQGASGLKQILLARKGEFCRCLTDRMMTYALGRGLEVYDRPFEDQITAGLARDNYKFSSLVMQIVQSDAFQKRGSKRGEQ